MGRRRETLAVREVDGRVLDPFATPMTITRQDVLHIARLARLRLEDHEVEGFIGELDRILEYIGLLRELDTTEIPAMSHVVVAESPLRDDTVAPALDRDAVLAEAPRRVGEGFAVPAFVDEG
ncbi:MAG: Asp-tRNA(Asn)/Glu-tRNA(Gln) amidotransferase subunit GatC [Polyangiaceae bacterium]|nr:Asp-tRNA(Asn)/Glu-tRNA(Gln) amidotransferase subunit GatC [Polyangiaceae bacterium]